MISLNANCDECRGLISEGDAAYCVSCWNTNELEIDSLNVHIGELNDEIADLRAQLAEAQIKP